MAHIVKTLGQNLPLNWAYFPHAHVFASYARGKPVWRGRRSRKSSRDEPEMKDKHQGVTRGRGSTSGMTARDLDKAVSEGQVATCANSGYRDLDSALGLWTEERC